MKIAIIDDELYMREKTKDILVKSLFESSYEFQIDAFESAEVFLNRTDESKYHVIVLDIEMQGMNGIQLAQKLESQESIILFLTSYEGYMKDAFGLNVRRYILKEDMESTLGSEILEIAQLLYQNSSVMLKIPEGTIKVKVDDILYVEYIDRKPIVHLCHDAPVVLSSMSLVSVFRSLNNSMFLHLNNQFIINMKHIQAIKQGNISLLHCDKKFIIPRGRKREVNKVYEEYLMKGDEL